MSFNKKFAEPGAKMSNSLMPRPSQSGKVIGPPKIKMPSRAGQHMPTMSSLMPKSSLSHDPSPLPAVPSIGMGPTSTPSLFHSRSPLSGIGKK